jgi:orotidine-5'-phosphate decarboxylase
MAGHIKPVIVALDFDSAEKAKQFSAGLDPQQCRVKVGFELFVAGGPELVKGLVAEGFDVFLDLKFHDIPNTVAAACRAAAELGVWMLNVHASGGTRMIQAAREALDTLDHKPYLIAVTVLTSTSDADLKDLGHAKNAADLVTQYALLAKAAGADGVVCSAQEASQLKIACGEDFLLVTPGIRPEGTDTNDQSRTMTPTMAIDAGSDFLVIGRPITQAADPKGVLSEIQLSLESNGV